MEGDIEKNSENLGRDAVFSKETKVNRLVSDSTNLILRQILTLKLFDIAKIPVCQFHEILLESSQRCRRHRGRKG